MLADFQMDVHVAWRKRFGSPHLERRLGNEFGVELSSSTSEGSVNPVLLPANIAVLHLGCPLE